MATIFKFNNKLYQCLSLDKKLKRLKINKEDIEILLEAELSQKELETKYLEFFNSGAEDVVETTDTKLHKFINHKDSSTIISIYPDLENLKSHLNINDYERI